DGARRLERDAGRLEGHLAAAASDQQDLEQVAVTVGADSPVVNRGARRDRLDVNEVEGLIVRRGAVGMKQWERRGVHAKSIDTPGAEKTRQVAVLPRHAPKPAAPPGAGPLAD